MRIFAQVFSRPRQRIAMPLGGALLAAAVLATSWVAWAQDQSAATPKDAIFARKVVMGAIGSHMDEIDTMVETGKIELTEGRDHADAISVLLMAFPHLFPPSTNQWKPDVERDPGTDTFAAPKIWTRYADFYKQAADSSKTAYNVSRAQNDEEFKKFGAQLRASCDACHATYMKPQ